MSSKARRIFLAGAIVAAGVLQVSCSSESGPQPGTPAFYWSTAKESFAANDYAKTSQTLEKIVASENDYTARAQAWLLVIDAGLLRGYVDLADSLEMGVGRRRAIRAGSESTSRIRAARPGGSRSSSPSPS